MPTAPFMATGRLGTAQLARLGETLATLAREPLFRVVLIHHPPVSEAKPHKRLIDAAEFLSVIVQHGAELVLHGHDHLHMLNWLAGPNRSARAGGGSAVGLGRMGDEQECRRL